MSIVKKHQQVFGLIIFALLFFFSSALAKDKCIYEAAQKEQISADRWIEIDLYWFDYNDMEGSCEEFWERYYPMFKNIAGWKGVILNVGWLMDIVYEWQGDLDKEIALPKDMEHWPFVKDEGQLTGDSEQRKKLWKHRFEIADEYEVVNYAPWRYGDLKKLVAILKEVASKNHNHDDVRIGILALGWQSIYDGELSTFSKIHTNAFKKGGNITRWGIPNLVAKLKEDHRKYGAYPDGISEGTPITEFFGRQWGDLSKKVGLDTIVLRDSIMGAGIYGKSGPFGKDVPADPDKVAQWSQATANLVKESKLSNPDALVIGYSNAATAVGDWRVVIGDDKLRIVLDQAETKLYIIENRDF